MYILLEGVDTSGKSTQIELLKKSFPEAIFTKEPGGTKLGVKIREILLQEKIVSKKAELLLFMTDRAELHDSLISKNLNKMIFSDRGFISGIAYALANKSNINIDLLLSLNKFCINDNLPDLVIIFKTNENLIKNRLDEKQKDIIESRGINYLLSVQENMFKILYRLNLTYIEIDSSKSVEEIHSLILKELKNKT